MSLGGFRLFSFFRPGAKHQVTLKRRSKYFNFYENKTLRLFFYFQISQTTITDKNELNHNSLTMSVSPDFKHVFQRMDETIADVCLRELNFSDGGCWMDDRPGLAMDRIQEAYRLARPLILHLVKETYLLNNIS